MRRTVTDKRQLFFKKRKGKKQKMTIPMRCKAIVFELYNSVEEEEERDHLSYIEAMLPTLNEYRAKEKLLPVAIPLDEDGDPCHPEQGGEVPEGHLPIAPSYYDKQCASSCWRLQNEFINMVETKKHRGHKAAMRLVEAMGLQDFFFESEGVRKVFGVTIATA